MLLLVRNKYFCNLNEKYYEIVNVFFNIGMLLYFFEVLKCIVKLGYVRFYTRYFFYFNVILLVYWYKLVRL